MNQRAKQLNMQDSNFSNTNGLPVAEHYTSAYDIAIMSKELLKFEKTKKWFTKWQTTIRVGLPGKEKKFGLTNTNKLIKIYPGAMGIKTGFTQDAGYCLSGAAQRKGTRLIGVILGSKTSDIRFKEISKMFDYGFANYETVNVGKAGQKQKALKLEKGMPRKLDVVLQDNVSILVKKGTKKSVTTKIKMKGYIDPPVKKGAQLGELIVYQEGQEKGRFPIIAGEEAKKASVMELYIQMMRNML